MNRTIKHLKNGFKPKISPGWIVAKFDDGLVHLMNDNPEGMFYEIDGVASEVLSQINGERSVDEIIREFKPKIDAPTFDLDAKQFILDLIELEVIESS